MNLLIAIMGSTYGRVEELGMIERNREMASLIYALERKYLRKNKEHSTEHFPGILIFAQRNTALVKERQRQFELKIHADADNGGSVEARLMGIDDKLTAVLSCVAGFEETQAKVLNRIASMEGSRATPSNRFQLARSVTALR
jgi:hypothetical protein